MKFWQKAFLGILVVFIIAINSCLYLTSNYSFSLNMRRDTDRSLGEYHFIINGISETMNSIYYRDQTLPAPASIASLMRSYADYYKQQNVFFEFKQSGAILFTNIPSNFQADLNTEGLTKNAYALKVLQNNGIHYLSITGNVGGQFSDYTFTYVRDLSELYSAHALLTRYLITVSALVETVLALVLVLLLRRLTHPIRIMQKATRKIAGGVYNERICIPSKDEFHDLAENFNQMALSIQEKINELDKNAQDKQRLIDNLAHELRTPLTAIRGYAEYLQSANTSEQNRIKATGHIIREIDRMKNLAFKLLDLALVRNSKPDLQEIVPSALLTQVGAASEPKLKEKGQRLAIHSSLKTLIGDSDLLQSLLLNLIDNAAKASAENSTISLSAFFAACPILEVKDSGCGMDAEQTALVCEPFYRVDKARSRSSGGVGLGLSLCREIARLHGGELRISSYPGKGTTVQVLFTTPLQLPENLLIPEDV
ncbi:HAMP domain-containing sensor histidine kinase [Desulfosporosinus sp. PR]|uniref:HAMP domain-containing sensor histidine kinase n=1 Tax=Candidatus Desulfosporosinus nitrosoreducens TaxID=3401928 RepID=UPI0027E67FB0|nr:HAMP domain-containing sensor histidine kinase [Desulfosporosinus sp. PR]MDQ7092858.1 HAMP domain-containing sensor histidine kinase [Desulfosporosinus sp. PR]